MMVTLSVLLQDRSELIATYALSGFASIPIIGIFVGAYGVIVPNKAAALRKFLLKGCVAATIASYLTACVAGR